MKPAPARQRLLVLLLLLASCRAWVQHAPLPRRRALGVGSRASVNDELGTNRNVEVEIDGNRICFDFYRGAQDKPGVVFLQSLSSSKNSAVSAALELWCRKQGRSYLCADYYGCGRSSGDFSEGTVSLWARQAAALIRYLLGEQSKSNAPPVLVGAGVGGWLALLIASARPELTSGIVGLAADPDFTEDLLMANLTEEQKKQIMEQGSQDIRWGNRWYPISRALIEDGRRNLLLRGGAGSIPVTCPVRLIHSVDDEEVPFETALKIAEVVRSDDVCCSLVKRSTHMLDEDEDFRRMKAAVEDVWSCYLAYDLTSPGSG